MSKHDLISSVNATTADHAAKLDIMVLQDTSLTFKEICFKHRWIYNFKLKTVEIKTAPLGGVQMTHKIWPDVTLAEASSTTRRRRTAGDLSIRTR